MLYILALYILFLVRYHIKSINKYVYHLVDIHIPHSLKRVLLLKLTAAICSLNCIQINVKYKIIIFKIIFRIRLEKGVYSVCCCPYFTRKSKEKNIQKSRPLPIPLIMTKNFLSWSVWHPEFCFTQDYMYWILHHIFRGVRSFCTKYHTSSLQNWLQVQYIANKHKF